MQVVLIVGIAFAIGAVMFALQNNVPVSVSLMLWSFEGSLALVLLLALGLGAVIAGLLSSPTVIKSQWSGARLRKQIAALERDKAMLTQRVGELEAEVRRLDPAAPALVPAKPYVGLKTLLTTGAAPTAEQTRLAQAPERKDGN